MVWRSFEPQEAEKNAGFLRNLKNSARLSHPTDRIAAVLIDLVVSLCISSLISAGVHKQVQESLLVGDNSKALVFIGIAMLIHLLFFVVFQAYFTTRFGASLGQRFFGVQVVHIWTGKSISFGMAALRSFLWCIQIPLLLPLGNIFTDAYRRMFHDKVSDSICLATQERFSMGPSAQERSFMRGLMIPAYLWIFALFVSLVANVANRLLEKEDWLVQLNSSIPYCEEVSEATSSWPVSNALEKESRLLVALSLYSADLVSKECLTAEADAAFLKKRELDYAYLAKSFVTESETELSNEYLLKVCEGDMVLSEACSFSRMIRHWAGDEMQDVSILMDTVVPNSKSFVKNWAIKYYTRNKEFSKAYSWIEDQSNNRELGSFLSGYRLKALWGMGRQAESIVSFQASRGTLNSEEERQSNAWLCWRISKDSCDGLNSFPCKGVEAWQPIDGGSYETDEILAIVNVKECRGKESRLEIANSLMGRSNAYERAFLKAYGGIENSLYEVLISGASSNLPEDLRGEIFGRITKTASLEQLKSLKKLLLKTEKTYSLWEENAVSLLQAFYRLEANEEANFFQEELQSLAKTNLALQIKLELQSAPETFSSRNSNRMPASQKRDWSEPSESRK